MHMPGKIKGCIGLSLGDEILHVEGVFQYVKILEKKEGDSG